MAINCDEIAKSAGIVLKPSESLTVDLPRSQRQVSIKVPIKSLQGSKKVYLSLKSRNDVISLLQFYRANFTVFSLELSKKLTAYTLS